MRELDEGLWVFDRPFRIAGMHIGTRMTAIRLADGGLFLHSPVPLDTRTVDELASLAPVRHVVSRYGPTYRWWTLLGATAKRTGPVKPAQS